MSTLHVRNIVNDIQTINQIHLNGESWDKVREGVNGAVKLDRETLQFERDMYKKAYENQVNTAFLLNEFRLWIRENKNATRNDILQIILHQEVEGIKAKLRDIRCV